MAIRFQIGAEESHKVGEVGAKKIRTWLDSTFRFRIDQSIYDLDPNGDPYPKLRVPQLVPSGSAVVYERFDLIGQCLDVNGRGGRVLYVECKEYSSDGNQGALYREFLAVCYSAFVRQSGLIGAPADWDFMWATTHPFSQTDYTRLTSPQYIQRACHEYAERLGDEAFDASIAQQLAERLWLCIVNRRVEDMIMGVDLRKAVQGRIVEMASGA